MNRILEAYRARQRRRPADIKAPDGFTLGGLRLVRKDATILFGRSWWKVPDEWIGKNVWVHVVDHLGEKIEAAPPGLHIYDALSEHREQIFRPVRTDRPDAAPGYRRADYKAWASRGA